MDASEPDTEPKGDVYFGSARFIVLIPLSEIAKSWFIELHKYEAN